MKYIFNQSNLHNFTERYFSNKLKLIVLCLIIFTFSLSLLIGLNPFKYKAMANDKPIEVIFDGELISFSDQKAIIKEGRVMIPARAIAETWGININWNPEQAEIILVYLENELKFNMNNQQTLINGKAVINDNPPIIIEGRLLMPLRLVSEAFVAQVSWNDKTRTAEINTDRSFKIKALDKAKGIYQSGDKVITQLTLQNTLNQSQVLWIGYSLKDPLGKYYDIPAKSITLGMEEIERIEMEWEVPVNINLISGEYDLFLTIWDLEPVHGQTRAKRLAHFESQGEVQIFRNIDNFNKFDNKIWNASKHSIGRGNFLPENVQLINETLRIILPGDCLSSGEIQSKELMKYGRYEVSLKAPDAPSSITGFFLYQAPDFMQEIDIEIYRGETNKIYFVLYAKGKKTKEIVKELDFDPAKDFHIYTIDYYPEQVSFYVDGEKLASFQDGIPQEKMYLMLNAWYPNWVEEPSDAKRSILEIDWIRY